MSTTNVVSMATKETMLLKLCEEKKIERNTGGIVQNSEFKVPSIYRTLSRSYTGRTAQAGVCIGDDPHRFNAWRQVALFREQ